MGSPSTPTPPDPSKTYEQGIQIYLKYLPQLLAAEYSSRQQYDPLDIQHQQDLQSQFGPTQYAQQLDAFKSLDPTYFANHETTGNTINDQLKLGSSLDSSQQGQIADYVRAAQVARGNTMGNAAATAEGYAVGDRGLQLQQQRTQNAISFLAAPTIAAQSGGVQPVSADRNPAFADPNAGFQGQQFALQNYQNILGANALTGPNPWGSALSGAAGGAAAGSAFGPYGTAIGAVAGGIYGGVSASDPRLKKDMRRIGDGPHGLGIYEFRYMGGNGDLYKGVRADEVESVMPEAVWTNPESGFKSVNYEMLGLQMERME